MLRRKLARFGHSNYLLVDKALMKVLGIAPKAEMTLELQGDKIVISKAPEPEMKRRAKDE